MRNQGSKEQYVSPLCEELRLQIEGVIATSAPDYEDGGTIG